MSRSRIGRSVNAGEVEGISQSRWAGFRRSKTVRSILLGLVLADTQQGMPLPLRLEQAVVISVLGPGSKKERP